MRIGWTIWRFRRFMSPYPSLNLTHQRFLFIEHHLAWIGVDKPDQMLKFNEVCGKRAQKGSPVVVITAVMDQGLLALDGKRIISSRWERLSSEEEPWHSRNRPSWINYWQEQWGMGRRGGYSDR